MVREGISEQFQRIANERNKCEGREMLCLELLLSSTLLAIMLNVFETAYSTHQKFGVLCKVTPFLKSAHNCPLLLEHCL